MAVCRTEIRVLVLSTQWFLTLERGSRTLQYTCRRDGNLVLGQSCHQLPSSRCESFWSSGDLTAATSNVRVIIQYSRGLSNQCTTMRLFVEDCKLYYQFIGNFRTWCIVAEPSKIDIAESNKTDRKLMNHKIHSVFGLMSGWLVGQNSLGMS